MLERFRKRCLVGDERLEVIVENKDGRKGKTLPRTGVWIWNEGENGDKMTSGDGQGRK